MNDKYYPSYEHENDVIRLGVLSGLVGIPDVADGYDTEDFIQIPEAVILEAAEGHWGDES